MHENDYQKKSDGGADPRRPGAKKRGSRRSVEDCDFGDVFEMPDGRRFVLTCALGKYGLLWGRQIIDGKEQELEPLPLGPIKEMIKEC